MRTRLNTWGAPPGQFPESGSDGEKLQFLVGYAVLAPSKCNAQPWLFEICGDSMDLICDRSWAFHEIDPVGRQLILSCGAALLNLTVAAHHFGCELRIDTFPWPGDRYLLARVRLARPAQGRRQRVHTPPALDPPIARAIPAVVAGDAPKDGELFEALTRRCTSRRRFRGRTPPDGALSALACGVTPYGAWLRFVTDQTARRHIAGLVAQGDRARMSNRKLRRELARWVRQPYGDSKDGFPVSRYGLPRPVGWLAPGLSLAMRALDLGQMVAVRDKRLAQSAPVLAVLGTEDDTPAAWLAAGQALESVWLRAAAAGLNLSPFSPPIEVPTLRSELARITGGAGFPQVLLRLGYGMAGRHTPRRPVNEVII